MKHITQKQWDNFWWEDLPMGLARLIGIIGGCAFIITFYTFFAATVLYAGFEIPYGVNADSNPFLLLTSWKFIFHMSIPLLAYGSYWGLRKLLRPTK